MELQETKNKLISDLLNKSSFRYKLPYNRSGIPPKQLKLCPEKQEINLNPPTQTDNDLNQVNIVKCRRRANNPFKAVRKIEKKQEHFLLAAEVKDSKSLFRKDVVKANDSNWSTPSLKRCVHVQSFSQKYQNYLLHKNKCRKLKIQNLEKSTFTTSLPKSIQYVKETVELPDGEIICVKFPKLVHSETKCKERRKQEKLIAPDLIWLQDKEGNVNGFPLFNEEQLLKWDIFRALERCYLDSDDDTPTTITQSEFASEQILEAIQIASKMYQKEE